MNDGPQPVTVHILDREYMVGCAPEERAGLIEAAARLDADMRRLRNNARGATTERIAVLAALNIAHELHGLRQRIGRDDADAASAIAAITRRLDDALSRS